MKAEKHERLWGQLRPWVSGYLPKLTLACIVLIVVMSFASEHFFSLTNFKDILLGTAVIGIISFGMTMVLISGDIDLSVGSVVAFSSVVLCVSLNADLGLPAFLVLPVALLLTAASAMAVGLVNGFFVSVLEINSFIITLGTMSVIRGLGFIVLGGTSEPFRNPIVRYLGSGTLLGVPIPICFMAAVLVILWFVLKYTQFGRNVYAIGNNRETARLSGINVVKTKLLVFSIMGLLSGVAGFLLAAQTYAGSSTAGQGYELDALTAVILGGTSLKGGQGRLAGTVLGTFFVAVLLNGQNMLNVAYEHQLVSKGVIILIAMALARKKT